MITFQFHGYGLISDKIWLFGNKNPRSQNLMKKPPKFWKKLSSGNNVSC